jgi:hypothetical protein
MSKALESMSPAEAAVGYFILWRVWYRLMQANPRDLEAMNTVDFLRISLQKNLPNDLFNAAHSAFRWTAGLPIGSDSFVGRAA